MYYPNTKYELPNQEEISNLKTFLTKNPYYNIGTRPLSLTNIFKNGIISPIIDTSLWFYTMGHLDKEKKFEFKCEQLFNQARYTIINSIILKKNHVHKPIDSIQIPIDSIEKCSGYNDFVSSLKGIGIKFISDKSNPTDKSNSTNNTGIILYHGKTETLIVLDEYKY